MASDDSGLLVITDVFDWKLPEPIEPPDSKSVDGDLNKYSPDQERDERGRFGSGGGSSKPSTATMSKTRASFEANVHPAIRDVLAKNGINPDDAFAARRFISDYDTTTQVITALQDAYMATDDSLEAGINAMEFANDQYYLAMTYLTNEDNWERFKNDAMSTEDSVIHDGTPSAIIDTLNEVSENGQVCIAIDEYSLAAVFEDGRFMSQFETGTSHGLLDEQMRRQDEFRTQGVSRGTPDEERPIYGYLIKDTEGRDGMSTLSSAIEATALGDFETSEQERDNNLALAQGFMESITSVVNPRADQYGNVRVVLNDSASEKTTFTLGDSLNQGEIAVPMGTKITEDVAIQQDLASAVDDPATIGYVEAQIHGGVSVSDIKEIYAPASVIQHIMNLIEENNLTIPVHPMPKDK